MCVGHVDLLFGHDGSAEGLETELRDCAIGWDEDALSAECVNTAAVDSQRTATASTGKSRCGRVQLSHGAASQQSAFSAELVTGLARCLHACLPYMEGGRA
jgi:hypothetical protein